MSWHQPTSLNWSRPSDWTYVATVLPPQRRNILCYRWNCIRICFDVVVQLELVVILWLSERMSELNMQSQSHGFHHIWTTSLTDKNGEAIYIYFGFRMSTSENLVERHNSFHFVVQHHISRSWLLCGAMLSTNNATPRSSLEAATSGVFWVCVVRCSP